MIQYLITLNFLPKGYNISRNTSIYSNIIPIFGLIFNIILAIVVNLFDFILWIPSKIPLLNRLLHYIYVSPDIDHKSNFIFKNSHRNMITHSIINPIFLFSITLIGVIIKYNNIMILNYILFLLLILISIPFISHLLSDALPINWNGLALIKLKFIIYIFTLPKILSKLWLILNSFSIFYFIYIIFIKYINLKV